MAKTFLVTSGKGGTGKSSITALLGRTLAGQGRNVLLLELDSGLRSLDMMLGVSDRVLYDAGDVLAGRCKPADSITVVPTSAGNLHYIAAPVNPSFVPERESLRRFIEGVGEYFDYLFIDSPAGLGETLSTVADLVDRALVITQAQPVPVRDAASVVALLGRWGCPGCRLVINQFTAKQINASVPDLDWVIDTANAQLIGIIPFDAALPEALANGRPLSGQTSAGLAIAAIAGRLEGRYTPLLATSLK